MYFNRFNKTVYDNGPKQIRNAVNIFNSVMLQYTPVNNINTYYYRQLVQGERPEDLSYIEYGKVEYHWIILLANNVINPYTDWYMSQWELDAYIDNKYDDPNDINHFLDVTDPKNPRRCDGYEFKHYYNELKVLQNPLPQYISPVTHTQYESEKNFEKFEVRVIDKRYIIDIVKQFESLMERQLLNAQDVR